MKNLEKCTKAELLALLQETKAVEKDVEKRINSKGKIYYRSINDGYILVMFDSNLVEKVRDICTIIKYHGLKDDSIKYRGNFKELSGLMIYVIDNDTKKDIEKRINLNVEFVEKTKDYMNKYADDYTPRKQKTKAVSFRDL